MLWSPKDLYIGHVEGDDASNVHLLDVTGAFVGGIGTGPYWRITDRGIDADLVVVGTTATNAQANAVAIAEMLVSAERGRGVYGQRPVILSLQLTDDTWRYIDVTGGSISTVRDFIGGQMALVTLSLTTRPYARGDAVTETATATLTNGAATWLVEDIPGDVPALARLTIEDVSTNGAVINGVHVYGRSMHGLEAGDYDPTVKLTAASPGATETDSTSYTGSNFARLTANSTWRTIAEATKPSGAANTGLYDLWLRVRDSSSVPSAPRNHEATVAPGVVVAQEAVYDSAGVSGNTIVVTTATDVAAGDTLILNIAANHGTATVSSISTVGGASWMLATDGVDDARVATTGYGGFDPIQIGQYWVQPPSGAPAGTIITVTLSTSMTERQAVLLKVSGLTATPVEQVAADMADIDLGTSVTTNSITTTQDHQLLVGTVASSNAVPTGYGNVTNWTEYQSAQMSTYARLVTADGTYSLTATGSSGSHVATLVSYKALSPAPADLTAGTWTVRVVAVGPGGELSPASEPGQVEVVGDDDAVLQAWDEPASGTPDSYRVYRDRGDGWAWRDTGSTATSYIWIDETSLTSGAPDIDGDPVGLFRVQVALKNGVTVFTGPATSGAIANDAWEDVLAGTFPLPPIPALDGADPPDWLVRVQGRHEDSATLDVDLAWLAAHDEGQTIARATGYALPDNRDWVLDQRRDGRVSGRLYEDGTTNDAGQVDTIGTLQVGPGATQLALRLTGEGGTSDVDDLKAVVTLRYVPRWKFLRGGAL